MIALHRLLAPAALLLAAAAPGTAPPPVPLRLIETISPQGVQEVSPGAIVSVAVLAKPDAAILAGDVVFDRGATLARLARGEILHAGADATLAKADHATFCASAPATGAAHICLFDADKDGKFDHAILPGAAGAATQPIAITPVEYGLIEGRRLSADSVARLRYVGPVESPSSIAFDLEAYANGAMQTVPHRRTFIPVAKLPAYAIIGVAVVTVLTYDAKTRVATIRMDHDLAPGHIVLPELNRAD